MPYRTLHPPARPLPSVPRPVPQPPEPALTLGQEFALAAGSIVTAALLGVLWLAW